MHNRASYVVLSASGITHHNHTHARMYHPPSAFFSLLVALLASWIGQAATVPTVDCAAICHHDCAAMASISLANRGQARDLIVGPLEQGTTIVLGLVLGPDVVCVVCAGLAAAVGVVRDCLSRLGGAATAYHAGKWGAYRGCVPCYDIGLCAMPVQVLELASRQ